MLEFIETTKDGEMIFEGDYSIKKIIVHDEEVFKVYFKGIRINQFGYFSRAVEWIEGNLDEL